MTYFVYRRHYAYRIIEDVALLRVRKPVQWTVLYVISINKQKKVGQSGHGQWLNWVWQVAMDLSLP